MTDLGFLTGLALKAAAEGKAGSQVAWVYWHLRGIKTIIGGALLGAALVVALLDKSGLCAWAASHWSWFACAAWAMWIAKWTALLGVFWVWLGQQDGALHLDAPEPIAEALDSFGRPRE